MNWKCALASAVIAFAFVPSVSFADNITDVENARAKERQGSYLTRQDREQLRRYGGNDDGPYYRYQPYSYGTYGAYGAGPSYRYRTYPY